MTKLDLQSPVVLRIDFLYYASSKIEGGSAWNEQTSKFYFSSEKMIIVIHIYHIFQGKEALYLGNLNYKNIDLIYC